MHIPLYVHFKQNNERMKKIAKKQLYQETNYILPHYIKNYEISDYYSIVLATYKERAVYFEDH